MFNKEDIKLSQIGNMILSDKIKGQYKHIDAIYDAATHSSDLGVKINNFLARSDFSAHVVYRTNFFADELSQLKGQKVASIACGSGLEIEKAYQLNPNLNCQIDCYDVDEMALNKLRSRGLKNINPIKLNVVNKPIKQKYDLIYCFGLFDYLHLKLSKRLINKLFNCLNKGGSLILGNVDINASHRDFMTNLLEWKLDYKSQEDLLSLGDGLDCSKFIFLDPMKIMNYLKLKKND